MIRCILAISLAICFVGCGPMTQPMVQRLSDEDQHSIDDAWEVMLQPPQRVDRTTFLDVLVACGLYQQGVDRLEMRSEKNVLGGRVIMLVRFDREKSALDEFSVTYVNRHGKEVRRERYSREDVEESLHALFGPIPESQPSGEPTPEERARRQRLQRIQAATQPADHAH